MSASVVLAAVSAQQAASANIHAHQAKVASCNAFMPLFDSKTATIESMQVYAKCVEVLHPESIGPNAVWLMKALFISALIGLVFGIFQGIKERDDALTVALRSLAFFLMMPILLLLLGFIVYGTYWLFT